MTTTDFTGPVAVFGASPYSDSNPSIAPSVFRDGVMLMDSRFGYDPDSSAQLRGWYGTTYIPVVDAVPSTLAANNIAASQTPTAGVALTLVSTTGAGITVGQGITNSATGGQVTGLLAIDGPVVPQTFGATLPNVSAWDPATAITRAIRIVSAGDDTGATFTVRGFDEYWYPVTEVVTGANGTATSVKCFKYIQSITPAGTLSGSAVTVGTADVFEFPLRVDFWGNVQIYWNNALITATTGFTAAVTTSPATATTGDVRGKYAVQSASDGTKRLQIFVTPSVANVGSATGLTGVTQFSS